MRQAGICAAACTYALDHHVDRLAEDHSNARALARGLAQISGVDVQQPETNLVFFKPDGAGIGGDDMVARLRQRGVLVAMMDGRIRACTHLDVTATMIEETVGLVREIVRGVRRASPGSAIGRHPAIEQCRVSAGNHDSERRQT